MPQVARLNIDLVARTAKMVAGLNTAQKRLSVFRDFVGRIMKRVAVATAAFAVALPAAFAAFVKPAFEAIDTTGKMARNLGVSVNELLAFEQAGKLAGETTETVHKTLRDFTRRLGEAATGTGEATDGYKALKLSTKELVKLPIAEAMKRTMNAIAAIENPAMRASAAYDVFGRQGQKLMQMLMGGAAAIESAQRELQDLGLTLSDMETLAVENVNDNFERMGVIIEGVRWKLAAGLAPVLAVLTEKFIEFGKQGATIGGAINAAMFRLNVTLAQTYELFHRIAGIIGSVDVMRLKAQIAINKQFGRSAKLLEEQLAVAQLVVSQFLSRDLSEEFLGDIAKKLMMGLQKADKGLGADLAGAAKLSAPALQRGDPGLQAIIKQTSGNKLAELVAIEKKAEADGKKRTRDLGEIARHMAGVREWMDVGVMAF